MKTKTAVLFPGIGYSIDKPLLYYSGRVAKELGYEVVSVPYSGFPTKVKGDAARMQQSYDIAFEQSKEILKDIRWGEDILFIGKSIGTIVAVQYAKAFDIPARYVLLTPLVETFEGIRAPATAFHGTADPWASTEEIKRRCAEKGIPLYLTAGANHSLETGDVGLDLRTLMETVETIRGFISAPC